MGVGVGERVGLAGLAVPAPSAPSDVFVPSSLSVVFGGHVRPPTSSVVAAAPSIEGGAVLTETRPDSCCCFATASDVPGADDCMLHDDCMMSASSSGVRRRRRPEGGRGGGASKKPRRCGPLSRRVLIVFSGPIGRPDGLAAELHQLGYETVEIDREDGGAAHDIRKDDVFRRLLDEVTLGMYCAVFLGVPCSTYSVARIRPDGVPDGGPPQVRDCDNVLGIPGLEAGWMREVRAANDVTSRSMAVASAAVASGASVIIENPVRRGVGSPWHEPRYSSHASLWDMPCVLRWRAEVGARAVDCAQCAFDPDGFQKLTTFLYSPDLRIAMSSLSAAVCTHEGEAHARVAHGVDSAGRYVSASAAAYPAALNVTLARAIAFPHVPCYPGSPQGHAGAGLDVVSPRDPFFGPEGLRAGSARPHAPKGEEGDARQERLVPSANPRRLEPELASVLSREVLPAVNVPPVTEWAEAPAPLPPDTPGPLHTHALIPSLMQQRLREFRISVRACFEAAKRGRWKWARDHRPKPLHAGEEECLLPAGRGFVWRQSQSDGLWRPLRPSHWPTEPPDCELELAVIVDEAVAMGFPDMEIISFMAHGYPGPEMSREAVLGPPHVGALKNPEGFEKCAAKDRDNGWVRWGSALPQVWPMRADPMNVVMRFGKARMTIDKTMELIEGLASYNQLIDLESQPEIEYVRVGQLSRAAALLLSTA